MFKRVASPHSDIEMKIGQNDSPQPVEKSAFSTLGNYPERFALWDAAESEYRLGAGSLSLDQGGLRAEINGRLK